MWASMGGRASIIDHFIVSPMALFQTDKAIALVDAEWYRSEDEEDGDRDSDRDDSEHEENPSPNRLIFDPSFLAEIAPDKPKGFFNRFK